MVPETTLTALSSIEPGKGQEVERLRRQVEVMLAHVLDLGLTPAPQAWMFEAVRDRNTVVDLAGVGVVGADGWNAAPTDADRMLATESLVRAHRELSRIVAPARPATLELLHNYREGRRPGKVVGGRIPRQAGPVAVPGPRKGLFRNVSLSGGLSPAGSTVPLVRWLMAATLAFLVAFVLLAAVPQAREASAGTGLGEGEPDFGTLLLREIFLLTAAALGAGLTALYRAGREVARGSYDPEFDHTFLQRILLGMAAGLVIAELVPLGAGDDTLSGLARPAVALLGGFAADAVHSVLTRLMAALEMLFNGGQVSREQAERELAEKRAEEVLAQADRATLNKLLEIRRIASSGAPTRAIIEEIDRVITVVAAPV
ncbi:hypothetical protein LWF15_05780 [Kineosporia rhizophila]|uniref:hypothetical protein n=1 Tax=Kineosporia TaxID=49184 RepID=UPI001E291E52|nr:MULTISPECIES: hypothetical protein [Kineosporia]MCE0535013.1 hypothetical protein [Kineosporia rhizophila]